MSARGWRFPRGLTIGLGTVLVSAWGVEWSRRLQTSSFAGYVGTFSKPGIREISSRTEHLGL
jgi:hypothetical protein